LLNLVLKLLLQVLLRDHLPVVPLLGLELQAELLQVVRRRVAL
jgi:hypothetical protein